jgi:hypothetical protein
MGVLKKPRKEARLRSVAPKKETKIKSAASVAPKKAPKLKTSAPKRKPNLSLPALPKKAKAKSAAPHAPPPPPPKKPRYKALIAICNPKSQEWLLERLTVMGASAINIFLASGIKKTQLLDLLGLVDNQKILIVCLIGEEVAPQMLELLKNELFTEPNTGIAFTINIDAYAGIKTMMMLDSYLLKLENERVSEDK